MENKMKETIMRIMDSTPENKVYKYPYSTLYACMMQAWKDGYKEASRWRCISEFDYKACNQLVLIRTDSGTRLCRYNYRIDAFVDEGSRARYYVYGDNISCFKYVEL